MKFPFKKLAPVREFSATNDLVGPNRFPSSGYIFSLTFMKSCSVP
jgi:hypothetical protein